MRERREGEESGEPGSACKRVAVSVQPPHLEAGHHHGGDLVRPQLALFRGAQRVEKVHRVQRVLVAAGRGRRRVGERRARCAATSMQQAGSTRQRLKHSPPAVVDLVLLRGS